MASLTDVYVNNRAMVISQKEPEGKSAKKATAATSKKRRLARATETVVVDGTSQDEAD